MDFFWLWAAPYVNNDWRRAWNWITFGRSLLEWEPPGARSDIVIGSSPHLLAALAAERLSQRWSVPFVLEVRDLWPEGLLAAGGRQGPAYHFFGQVARHLYRRAQRVIVVARGAGDYLVGRGLPPEKISLVPNGVDPTRYTTTVRTAREVLTFVYAGAHGPVNGLDVVLDAAERLREHKGIRFLLVGDGPSKSSLVAEARRRGLPNVEFRDPVPSREMPRLLAEADAGLMVLRETPLFSFAVSPNKLFDYLAAGLPVVNNVPGEVAGMLGSAGAGEQAADGGPQALADAVLRLAACPDEDRIRWGEAGRDWVRREHSRSRLADALDEALRPVLGKRC